MPMNSRCRRKCVLEFVVDDFSGVVLVMVESSCRQFL